MINPLSEDVICLTDAAKECPKRRRGKRPHVSCMYRWTNHGCRGVVLESIQVGGTRCTSHQALARFFERLTASAHGPPSAVERESHPPDGLIAAKKKEESERTIVEHPSGQ
jgi:hypothetical protein